MTTPSWYTRWKAWRLAGAPKTRRPKGVPAFIPAWAWKRLRAETTKPKPPPPTFPTPDLSSVRNILFWATASDDAVLEALTLPPRWKFAFSADPAYKPSEALAATCIRQGRDVRCWCDCRTTLPAAAKEMVRSYGLSDWYGQAENAGEFDIAWAGGAPAVIGNISSLRDDQLDKVATAQILFVNETYYNVQPNLKPNWRNANAGIGGNCIAVYRSAPEGAVYTSVQNHLDNGWFNPRTDSIYTEGMLPMDWQTVRACG